MPSSNTTKIRKLQKALNSKGQKILYSTSQFYSAEQDRPVTMYHIKQGVWDNSRQRNQSVELFSSYSQIQIVLFLRDLWNKVNNIPLPTDNEVWNDIRKDIDILNDISI